MQELEKPVKSYHKEGYAQQAVGNIIVLVVGVAVATVTMIFAGALGGQTWQLVESDIDSITNTTIKGYIKEGVASSFKAQKQTGDYMPLIVLAVIITLVLGMILGMLSFAGVGGGYQGGTVL